MALKRRGMVSQVVGNTPFALEAKAGESILVLDVFVHNPASDYVTLSTSNTTVGFFRVGGVLGNHLAFPTVDLRDDNSLLTFLREAGVFTGYPVGEGEDFRITGAQQAGSIVHVHYDVYEAGDMQPEMPNGSKSDEYLYVSYGNTGAAITAAGIFDYTTPVTPNEFPNFPFGKDVPSKYNLALIGLLGSEHGVGAAGPTDTLGSMYFKMVRDREVLFDEDNIGYLMYRDASTLTAPVVGGGQSELRNHSSVDSRSPKLYIDPIVFGPGEELNCSIQYGFAAGAPSVAVGYQEVGLIIKATKIS